MALIKLGGLVTRISGKIGGQTFGTSASGSYVKNSGTPRKSITTKQKLAMSLMGTTAQSWRALTQLQRDTFNAASPDYPYLNRVGETKFYSGYAIFGQLRNNALNVSFSGIPVPLPKFTFTPLDEIDFTDLPDDGNLYAQSGQAGVTYQLFTSRISSVGISNAYRNQFFISTDTAAVGGAVQLPFSTPYVARFGSEPSSGKLFWRVDAIDNSTGQSYKSLNSGVYSY